MIYINNFKTKAEFWLFLMSIKDLFLIEDSQLVKVGHWDTETLMGLETVDLWDSQLVKVGHWDTETHIKY